jgi:hypothetical protein
VCGKLSVSLFLICSFRCSKALELLLSKYYTRAASDRSFNNGEWENFFRKKDFTATSFSLIDTLSISMLSMFIVACYSKLKTKNTINGFLSKTYGKCRVD